ncbi:MAG: radical SAM protein [Candidatus Marinimicrobia bacterium]|nr:radical SAM protein [Candidatus Neomarinimicrobiota bacterium]
MNTIIEKVQLSSNKTITFTFKENVINIFEEPQNNLWTFDLEGRLVGMFIEGKNYRRTLNNQYFLKLRSTIGDEHFRDIKQIPIDEIKPLIEQSHILIRSNQYRLPNVFHTPLSKILKMNSTVLQNSAKEFNNIYLPISILPPDQYMSLVIQMTEGCNYNQCTFCNFYRDRPFKIKSADELKRHLNKVKSFFGEGINLRKSIFLADANALAVPQIRLIKGLELIHNIFPQFFNYYSFIDVFTGLKKSANDFKQVNMLSVKRVYLGVESGNSNLMLFLNKHQLNKDIIELTHNLKSGGINVGVIFLIGAGGNKYAEKHLIESLKLLEQLPLGKGDIIYLSELYKTNSSYEKSMAEQNIPLPTRQKIRQWSTEFKTELKKQYAKNMQISIYDINQFFY